MAGCRYQSATHVVRVRGRRNRRSREPATEIRRIHGLASCCASNDSSSHQHLQVPARCHRVTPPPRQAGSLPDTDPFRAPGPSQALDGGTFSPRIVIEGATRCVGGLRGNFGRASPRLPRWWTSKNSELLPECSPSYHSLAGRTRCLGGWGHVAHAENRRREKLSKAWRFPPEESAAYDVSPRTSAVVAPGVSGALRMTPRQ